MSKEYKFQDGCMWEGGEWFILTDYKARDLLSGPEPCKHCHSVEMVIKGFEHHREWICPYVVVARNEGGYASTGVCLDCILEAAKEIKR